MSTSELEEAWRAGNMSQSRQLVVIKDKQAREERKFSLRDFPQVPSLGTEQRSINTATPLSLGCW